jgi:hypothetical protein
MNLKAFTKIWSSFMLDNPEFRKWLAGVIGVGWGCCTLTIVPQDA